MAYFLKSFNKTIKGIMKKFGIFLLLAGVLTMSIAAYKFAKQKNRGSEEQVQDQNTPFPWLPSVGALLTATGIIMMGSGSYRKVE